MSFKRAFSLIELLIVIMIIGVVYTLSINSFEQIKENKKAITLSSLEEYLKQFEYEKSAEFLCLDDCSECDILIDSKVVQEMKGSFDGFLDDSIKVYRYEYGLGAIELEPKSYFNVEDVEEEVCFSYLVNKRGIGNQVLVEYKDFVYDFSTYFEKTPKYDSLEEAIDVKDKLIEDVLK